MFRILLRPSCALMLFVSLKGCAIPPAGRQSVDLAAFDRQSDVANATIVNPSWPLRVAVVRLQHEPISDHRGWRHVSVDADGTIDSPSALLIRTDDGDIDSALSDPAKIGGVVQLGGASTALDEAGRTRLLRDARDAGADLVLVYSLESHAASSPITGFLSLLTLGLIPEVVAEGTAAASSRLIDARSGYVYSFEDASSNAWQPANLYTDSEAEIDTLLRAERYATRALFERVRERWPNWRQHAEKSGRIYDGDDRSRGLYPVPSGSRYETSRE